MNNRKILQISFCLSIDNQNRVKAKDVKAVMYFAFNAKNENKRYTWSVPVSSLKNGIFLAHSTAENNNLAPNS